MTTGTPAKTCIKCGQDCSGKPRTKDAQGRYTCRECFDKLTAARAAQPAAAVEVKPAKAGVQAAAKPVVVTRPAAAAKAVGAAAPAAAAEEPALTFDDGAGFGEGLGVEEMDAGIAAIAAAQPKECQNCGLFLPQSTVICTRCGLNTQTGKVLGTEKIVGETRQCIKCGYSLKGLKNMKCPECGTVNLVKTKEDKQREDIRKTSRAVVRNEYLKPLIMFVVGLAIAVGIASQVGADPTGTVILLLIKYAVFVPIGVIVFFVCCLLWMGFDAPMHLTALRLAAAFALTDTMYIPSQMLGFYGIGVTICALGLILHVLMDLDIQDAIIMAVLLNLVQFGVLIAIVAAMQGAG